MARHLLILAVTAALAALLPGQKLIPAYPERDILSPFRYPTDIYAPPDAVYDQLRVMRTLANDPATEKHFDEHGLEIVDDPRWQHAREELGKLMLDAGYLAQIMRISRNADERDLAFYGMFFCADSAYVFNLISHIPGEPVLKTREQAYPRAIAYIKAHLGRRWGDLSPAEQQALQLPAIGSPAANAAGLRRAPQDKDFLYSLNLRPFVQLLALDSAIDQAQGLWFLKECSLLRLDLAKAWLEPAVPRLRDLLHSSDKQVREQAIGLYQAIGGEQLGEPPADEGDGLDAWAEQAERHLFPPIRVLSDALVLLLPSQDRDVLAEQGRAALLGQSIGEAVNAKTKDGKLVRGFRVGHLPDGLKVLQLPDGAVITALNGEPVDDGQRLLQQIERALQLRQDKSGRTLNPTRSLLVEYLHEDEPKAIEYRVK